MLENTGVQVTIVMQSNMPKHLSRQSYPCEGLGVWAAEEGGQMRVACMEVLFSVILR